MNLSQIQSKSKLVIVGVVAVLGVILLLAIFSLGGRNKKQNNQPAPSITPEQFIPPLDQRDPIPPKTSDLKTQLIASATDDNGDKVLTTNSDFRIVYVPSLDMFFVQILQTPAETARSLAQNWFLEKGFSQQDLCQLPVRFILFDISLKSTNPNFNLLPDGCS